MPGSIGAFDTIIKQVLAARKHGDEDTLHKRLKDAERSMEPRKHPQPQVLMEKDKQEYDYPFTRDYDYVRKHGQPQPAPKTNEDEEVRQRKPQNIADETPRDRMIKKQYDVDHWQRRGERMTEEQMWDHIVGSVITNPGNKTVNRGTTKKATDRSR